MKEQKVPTPPSPEKIIRAQISPIEVGKYYLKGELGRVFPGSKDFRAAIDGHIDSMDDLEFWRLFEALSFAYRLNYVFRFVGNAGYSWSEELWAISDLTLTGMSPEINLITHSTEIERSPIKFRNYLKKYFNEHPHDDPQKLDQFRPTNRDVFYPKILLRQKEDKILLLDGSNRLISLMLLGNENVAAFIGRKTGKGEKQRVGDSTFLLLRNLYEKGDKGVKRAVLKVVRTLLQLSSDGEQAVETYWVKHPRDEALRKVGQNLIKGIKRGN